jgi:hypothetical protein
MIIMLRPTLNNFREWISQEIVKGKVKCTLVHVLRICTGCTARRRSRGIALPFLDHGTSRGDGSASRPGRFLPPGKTRYPLYRKGKGSYSLFCRKCSLVILKYSFVHCNINSHRRHWDKPDQHDGYL